MATELDKALRAKEYIDALAQGVDPFTGEMLPEDNIVNNARMVRCMNYVSDVLRRVIENGGEVGGGAKVSKVYVRPFEITPEQIERIERTEEPVGVSIIASRIKAVLSEGVKAPTGSKIADWCMAQGFLTEETRGGKKSKVATAKGNQLGIITIDGVNMQGIAYKKNIYDINAQKYIYEHLSEIAQFIQG